MTAIVAHNQHGVRICRWDVKDDVKAIALNLVRNSAPRWVSGFSVDGYGIVTIVRSTTAGDYDRPKWFRVMRLNAGGGGEFEDFRATVLGAAQALKALKVEKQGGAYA